MNIGKYPEINHLILEYHKELRECASNMERTLRKYIVYLTWDGQEEPFIYDTERDDLSQFAEKFGLEKEKIKEVVGEIKPWSKIEIIPKPIEVENLIPAKKKDLLSSFISVAFNAIHCNVSLFAVVLMVFAVIIAVILAIYQENICALFSKPKVTFHQRPHVGIGYHSAFL